MTPEAAFNASTQPSARPSLSIAAGETAAIMFTAAVFYTPKMPDSIFSDVMAPALKSRKAVPASSLERPFGANGIPKGQRPFGRRRLYFLMRFSQSFMSFIFLRRWRCSSLHTSGVFLA